MTQIFEKLPQIAAGVSLLILTLAITHEIAYFSVVAPQLQSVVSATDYLVTALSWMPLLGVSLFILIVGTLAFARWTDGRPYDEVKSSPVKRHRIVVHIIDAVFGAPTLIAISGAAVLFGNPYVLSFAVMWVGAAAVRFLIWLTKFEPFGRFLNPTTIILGSLFPTLLVISYVTGRADAYRDMTVAASTYLLKLKNSTTESKISILRLLSAGVLEKNIEDHKITFFRWDDIEALSKNATPLDDRSIFCRITKLSCPTKDSANATK